MVQPTTVRAWDPLVCSIYWVLVAAFAVTYASADHWMQIHMIAGYVVLGLVLLRVLWGLIGPRYARLSGFTHSPVRMWDYLKQLVLLQKPRYLGHNPVGGLMVLALLVSVVLTGVSGVMLYDATYGSGALSQWMATQYWNPYEALDDSHEALANWTVFLLLLHFAGIALDTILHGDNPVRVLFTGKQTEMR